MNLQILDGKELLNERTNTENRYLKKVGSVQFAQLRTSPSAVFLVLESTISCVGIFTCKNDLSVFLGNGNCFWPLGQMSCELTVLFSFLCLTETGVMEASLSDNCRQQGELRQGMFHQPPLFAVNSEHVVDTGPIPFPSYNITTMPNKTGSALLTLFFSFQKCYA